MIECNHSLSELTWTPERTAPLNSSTVHGSTVIGSLLIVYIDYPQGSIEVIVWADYGKHQMQNVLHLSIFVLQSTLTFQTGMRVFIDTFEWCF